LGIYGFIEGDGLNYKKNKYCYKMEIDYKFTRNQLSR